MGVFYEVFSKLNIQEFDLDFFLLDNEIQEWEKGEYDFSSLADLTGIYLKDLEVKDDYRGQGFARGLVNELKEKSLPIVLYSLFEATEFWKNQGFESVDGHDYIYLWRPNK